jgi:hypothetical protein
MTVPLYQCIWLNTALDIWQQRQSLFLGHLRPLLGIVLGVLQVITDLYSQERYSLGQHVQCVYFTAKIPHPSPP